MAPVAKAFPPTDSPPSVPAKRSSKLLLIILLIVALVLILVVIGFAALVMMKKGSSGNTAASQEPSVAPPSLAAPVAFTSAIDLSKPPIFVQLEPFTVNLRAREGEDGHYLQTDIALRVSDQKTADALKSWMPEIRNRINLILTSKSIFDMQNDLSHEKTQNEILRGLNTMFGVPPPPPEVPLAQAPLGPVQGVLFISFIVQ